MSKYVLYEDPNGNMLFTKEELVKNDSNLLAPFENKNPTLVIEADDDNDAVTKLNGHMLLRGSKQQQK
ncbi:MAG: hypothetical protein AABY15_01695 [Nanoarchaeota archaeon]